MQRPIMNPSYLDEPAPQPRGPGVWLRVGRLLWRVVRILFTDLLRRRNADFRVEIGSPVSRFLRGLFYRVMLLPVLLTLAVACLVATATHPIRPTITVDPASTGIYYDPVEILSSDNTRLEGWLVPVVDAHRVLVEGESLLHKRYPAVVLVHDFGLSRQQMLPLVAPLHDAGYVLLAINLRGGASHSSASTFGLNEAQDVRAAVDMLRRRPFVDPDAIGVLGIGTGATAALLAAQQDSRLHVLVLDHPVRQFEDVLCERIGPRQSWMAWLRPICKLAFEIAYKVDVQDINLNRFGLMMQNAPVLMLDDPNECASSIKPARQAQIVDFLKKHLVARPRASTPLMQRHSGTQVVETSAEEDAAGQSWPPQRTAREMLNQ